MASPEIFNHRQISIHNSVGFHRLACATKKRGIVIQQWTGKRNRVAGQQSSAKCDRPSGFGQYEEVYLRPMNSRSSHPMRAASIGR